MESLQRALDALIRELRRGAILREHGFSILFYAMGAAAVRALSAKFPLDSFAGRAIGQAAVEGVSVDARIATYAQALLMFVAAAVAAIIVLPRFTSWAGASAGRALEATSLCGLALFVFAAWRVDTRGMMSLLIGAQVLIAVPAALDRLLASRARFAAPIRDPGSYAAWLGGTGFALIVPITDFGPRLPPVFWALPAVVVAFALGIDLVRRLVCSLPLRNDAAGDGRQRRSDRFVHALAPLAVLAAACVLRNELYLLLNQHGFLSIRPEHVEIGLCVLVALWCVSRALRGLRPAELLPDGRLDIERLIGRFTFPWIVGGTIAMMRFGFLVGPSPDFLEPANAGLMIQQWFDFGRVPFLETFGAHGLYDSFFGFVYVALSGTHDATWSQYDYGVYIVTALVTYHVLRAWWSSTAAAMFCMLALPRISALFPDYCAQAGVSIFILRWVFTRRTAAAWALFAAWTAFVFLWRLDVGFANALASAGAIAAMVVLLPEYRPPISAMLRGTLATVGVLLVLYLGACWSRGVHPIALFRDFAAVVGSNQAFGFAILARERNEIVLTHVFVLPVLVMVACVAMLLRMRGRADPRDKVFFALLGTAWCSAYYFANYPRGLVRHTFVEGTNVVLSSFAFLVLAGSWRWILPDQRRVAAFGAFLLTATLLAWDFDFGNTRARTQLATASQLERVALALREAPRVTYQRRRIDRVEESPWFQDIAQPMVSFLQTELGPGETFLDLSNSPMLYYHTRRPSPHWLNHVLLVYGERLQRRFIEELEQHDIPIVVMPSLPALALKVGLPDMALLDGVPFQLRQYRLFEWVYSRYEPATVVGRWQVWVRKDRLLTQPPRVAKEPDPTATSPTATSSTPARPLERRLFALDEALPADDTAPGMGTLTVTVGDAAPVRVRGPIRLEPDRACALRIAGRSERGAQLDIAMELDLAQDLAADARTCSFPAGKCERWYWIPRKSVPRALRSLALRPHGSFQLDALELWEFDSPACRMLDQFLGWGDLTDLRHLAYLWGSRDEASSEPPRILRTLAGSEVDAPRGVLHPAFVEDADWSRGIHLHEAALRLADEVTPVQVGDRLLFSGSGARRVTRVDGRDVHVEGAPLDPVRDGTPRVVRFLTADASDGGSIRPRRARVYPFDPLGPPRDAAGTREAGAYVRLRLRGTGARGSQVILGYGAGELGAGRFMLNLQDDDLVHDYAVRISIHANWERLDCDWIRLVPVAGTVEVVGAWITAGD